METKTMKVTLTRRSKLGWDYNTSVENDEDGHWFIPEPEKPYYTGTYNQVSQSIQNDANFHSLGGTYYSSKWFAKVNGKWCKIDTSDHSEWAMFGLDDYPQIEVDVFIND